MARWLSINGGLSEHGLRDIGASFKAKDMISSLVRESVQNSLDAKRLDADRVMVDFAYQRIKPYSIPDIINLRKIFGHCEQFVSSKQEKEFFKKGREEILHPGEAETLGLLRIGDHGTIGLTGVQQYTEDGRFRSLVTRMGMGNDDGLRGGNFGVGKQALFLASKVRTVFFSTIDSETGYEGHMGVAILSSFRDPALGHGPDGKALCADRTVYYCDEGYDPTKQTGNPAINGQFAFANRKGNDFGTDVFIVGFDAETPEKLSYDILTVLLKEFIIAIDEKRLEVVLPDGFILRKDTLDKGCQRFLAGRPGKKDRRKVEGYHALLKEPWIDSPFKPVGDGIPPFPKGAIQCKFVRDDDENFCRVTREKGMFVHTFKNVCGSANCIGIVAIRDQQLNAAFKEMENEAHDRFEVTNQRFPDFKRLEVAQAQLQALEEIVVECANQAIGASIEAKTEAILPDELQELMDICAGQMTVASVKGKKSSAKITATRVKRHKRKATPVVQAGAAGVDSDDNPNDDTNTGIQTTGKKKNKSGKGSSGGKKHVNPASPEANGYAMRPLKVAPVFHASDVASSGRYKVTFTVPRSKEKVCLCFSATTESDSQERLDVLSATATGAGGESVPCAVDLEGTAVAFENVKAGQVISVEIVFDISYYCYSQVRYYEKKNN